MISVQIITYLKISKTYDNARMSCDLPKQINAHENAIGKQPNIMKFIKKLISANDIQPFDMK